MGKLNLLHHKSYHPYKAENIFKVERDEAAHRAKEEESDRKIEVADSEARVDRMRKKNLTLQRKNEKRDARDGNGPGEKELDRQLKGGKGKGVEVDSSGTTTGESGGSRIIRMEASAAASTSDVRMEGKDGHINFWQDLESGVRFFLSRVLSNLTSLTFFSSLASLLCDQNLDKSVNPAALLAKALLKEELSNQTKIYLAKKGEGDPLGWYASSDGKSEKERKEGVEGGLERVYKDNQTKLLTDPLALMNSYLSKRSSILSGTSTSSSPRTNGRKPFYPNPEKEDDLSEVVEKLLAPRRRKGDRPDLPSTSTSSSRHIPSPGSYQHPHSLPSSSSHTHLTSTSKQTQTQTLEQSTALRQTSERARALALIASRRPPPSSSGSTTSGTPRSESGFGMFNRDETREAGMRRAGGGWKEMRDRREDRGRRW